MTLLRLVVSVTLATVLLATLQAQSPARRKSVRAVRTDTPPVLDGRLDDEVWKSANAFDDFEQASPMEGAAPAQRTEVRILFDDRNLYMGVRCFDTDPAAIVTTRMGRDDSVFSDDNVSITLGTFGNQRDGYQYEFNAAGARSDALLRRGDSIRNWDGIFFSRASIDGRGWSVEFQLPFQSVSFDPATDAWDLNIERTIKRLSQRVRWSSPTLNTRVSNLAVSGRLEGLSGLKQGVGLDFLPYGRADFKHQDSDDDVQGDVGFDLRYRITPSLAATMTVNTDFAATEVDDRQVNLTRFPLFFPEKRDFFLQDAGLFNFGGRERDVIPFFSRRIGISGGDPVDLLGGGKLTGRAGDWSIGILDVQQDEFEAVESKNLAVGRVAYNVQKESTVGIIGTHGDPTSNGDNTLWGLDYNFRDSSFFDGGGVLEGNVWFQQTFDSVADDGEAFGASISAPNDRLRWSAEFNQVSDDFRPDLGFVRRLGVRRYRASVRPRWRPDELASGDLGIRSIDTELSTFVITGFDDEIQSMEVEWDVVSFRTNLGDRLGFSLAWNEEQLDADFEISDGVIIPPGTYTFPRYSVGFNSASARPLGFDLNLGMGEFFDGHRTSVFSALQFRPSKYFRADVEYQFNEVDLRGGSFQTHLVRFPVRMFVSPFHSIAILPQYDDISDDLFVNARYRWILEDGQDLFVVVNHGAEILGGSYQSQTTALTLKLGLTLRF